MELVFSFYYLGSYRKESNLFLFLKYYMQLLIIDLTFIIFTFVKNEVSTPNRA